MWSSLFPHLFSGTLRRPQRVFHHPFTYLYLSLSLSLCLSHSLVSFAPSSLYNPPSPFSHPQHHLLLEINGYGNSFRRCSSAPLSNHAYPTIFALQGNISFIYINLFLELALPVYRTKEPNYQGSHWVYLPTKPCITVLSQ